MAHTLTPAEKRDNYRAACLAAPWVALEARTCPRHRASLEAWRAGERETPWPDPTPEEQAAADAVMAELAEAFLGHKLPRAAESYVLAGAA